MEATPAAVRRIFDAVDHSRADPAASAASVERIDSEDKRTALANRVLIDALPVAARVGIAKAVGVRAGNVRAAAVHIATIVPVDIQRIGVVRRNGERAGA